MRRCCVNFQCLGVLLIWITVGQEHIALVVGAGGVVWTFFLSSIFSLFFLPLWETARYRLKYCLLGPLNPKQPTNQKLPQTQMGLCPSCLPQFRIQLSVRHFNNNLLLQETYCPDSYYDNPSLKSGFSAIPLSSSEINNIPRKSLNPPMIIISLVMSIKML